MRTDRVFTPHLGREVFLRQDTHDRRVWADTFTGLYHIPPWTERADPATVLDCGANIGLTTAHYQHMWPDAHVVAVEMDDRNASLASLNTQGRVIVGAVTGSDGVAIYDTASETDSYRVASAGTPATILAKAVSGFETVTSFRLSTLISHAFLAGHVDFVKLDIEDAEWLILNAHDDPWHTMVDTLLVELHPPFPGKRTSRHTLIRRAIRLLDDRGFDAERHYRHPQAVWAVRRRP